MKKLMITAAAALCATVVFGEEVASANIVGYMNKGLNQGAFSILGVQFENVGEAGMDINKLITGLTGVDFDEGGDFLKTAPHIQVPAKVGYDLYYYLNDGFYINEQGEEAYKAGWCDEFGTIAGDDAAGAVVSGILTPGVAIWVKDVGASEDVVQSGQVSDTDSVSVECPAVFALRAHSLPVAFNLNDTSKISFDGLAGVNFDEGGDFLKTAPHIQVPAKVGYDLYYYLNDGFYINEQGEEAYKAGWCDEFGTIAGDDAAGAVVSGDVGASVGFWTKGVGSTFTVTFKK